MNVFIRTKIKERICIKFVPKEEVPTTVEKFTTLRSSGQYGHVELVQAETPEDAITSNIIIQ